VGESFTGDALPRDERLLERFFVVGPAGEAPVAGVDGVRPAGVLSPAEPGLYVVGFESKASVAELSPDALAFYVEQEGLERQLAKAAPALQPIRDGFSRCAKTLVVVPGGKAEGFDRRLGLPLELVPLLDPHHLLAAEAPPADGPAAGRPLRLPLELLYEGKPLADVRVTALHRDDPLHPLTAWTNREGRVLFTLPRTGAWLIKAVRIERMPEGAEMEYRSIWASLTFELGGP
jgi:Domain of unknown function (DUF4198)